MTLPLPAGTWTLDPVHSGVTFKVRHLGLTNVRGRFNTFTSTLEVGESLDDTKFTATVDVASIDTNQPDRDAHLRSTDIFSADERPELTFESTAIRPKDDGEYEADGTLTMNGISKAITLDVEFTGTAPNPASGQQHAGFVATTTVEREAFGIDFNMPLGMDKVALGRKIAVELDIEFVAPQS